MCGSLFAQYLVAGRRRRITPVGAVALVAHMDESRPMPTLARGVSRVRDDLRAQLDAQQMRTFTRWWNSWLIKLGLKIDSLEEDVRPGVFPIRLLDALSGTTTKCNTKPMSKFQMYENHNILLALLKARDIKLVNALPRVPGPLALLRPTHQACAHPSAVRR